ncbi:MAG: hypothetical protein [Thorarchaeia virus VerdaV2]|uniref:Uncharacterized protein n=1 Tax=Thorarchaeia virus VerdaV2 TaxID=3070171 RepID=A0AA35CRB2_9CAUD|nr:MAG: hypothetical protein QIT42_gp17 [Thorarchaeia virus VerdaV2]BDI54911.1 MAG: hypothetical protein [Thorarchaeia virus VerdaV2]
MPVKKFGSLRPKDDKKALDDVVDPDPEIDVKKITQENFDLREFIDVAYDLAQPRTAPKTEYIPGTVRLMTIFELLTDKSFPRKGPGKSTKEKILDAIVMAALDKKLILQGA